ncbi:stonustoxin subunit beta-like [Hoplias malabaricus]|uniref:stonustoxin subunit beta-like n=1 Tax=Hoplias malabaricus TaxID=27720 RepID=UPI0034618CEB
MDLDLLPEDLYTDPSTDGEQSGKNNVQAPEMCVDCYCDCVCNVIKDLNISSGAETPESEVEPTGNIRIESGLRKYVCDLTLDPNTAHTRLFLSEKNRKVMCMNQQQSYPDHPERFDSWEQVLCRESLTGRCYWEVEWSGSVEVAVTCKGIPRKGEGNDCVFGCSGISWSLYCSSNSYCVLHNKKRTILPPPPYGSNRVGVFVDCSAGKLSFYSVSTDTHTLTHLHTFHFTFTEPLYAGFWVYSNSSVHLCKI